MRLGDAALKDHRPLQFPPRGDNFHAGLDVREVLRTEDCLWQMAERLGACCRRALSHDCGNMLLIKPMDFVHTAPSASRAAMTSEAMR